MIFLVVLTLCGCTQSGDLSNMQNSINQYMPGSVAEVLISSNDLASLEMDTTANIQSNSAIPLINLKMDLGKIETLQFNKQYLLTNRNNSCRLEICTRSSQDEMLIIAMDVNERENIIEHSYDILEEALCYCNSEGEYKIILCGKRGNDDNLITIYSVNEIDVTMEKEISGEIKEISGHWEIKVESRQFLIGFQKLTAIYVISDNGEIVQKEEFVIGNDTFSLVKDMPVKVYNPGLKDYRETKIPAGEQLTFYKTDMNSRLYFKRNNDEEGYIEIKFINNYDGFSVNGIGLVDYFDGKELSWAG